MLIRTWHLLACHHVNRIQWVNEGQLVYIVMWHWYYEEDRPLSISMRPLTHWSLVTHICVSEVGHRHHWFRQWLVAWVHQAITWTNTDLLSIGPPGKKLQSNSNQNSNIFIEQNAFENVVCILSPNCHGLNVLTVPALHMSMHFSCHQESLCGYWCGNDIIILLDHVCIPVNENLTLTGMVLCQQESVSFWVHVDLDTGMALRVLLMLGQYLFRLTHWGRD